MYEDVKRQVGIANRILAEVGFASGVLTSLGHISMRVPENPNHFIVKGGLRDFADVVSYLRNPIILVLEVLFLVVVTIHAMLGVRSIVLDFGISDRAEKRLGQALTVVGVLTVAYGLWLTWVIVH